MKTFSSDYINAVTEGFQGNVNTLSHLQTLTGYTDNTVCELCGVSLSTYRRWKRNNNPNIASLRLLAVMAGYMPWDKWQGWEMHNGYMFPPGYSKNGIPPGEFFSFIFKNQYISSIEKRLKNQEKEITELKERINNLRKPDNQNLHHDKRWWQRRSCIRARSVL